MLEDVGAFSGPMCVHAPGKRKCKFVGCLLKAMGLSLKHVRCDMPFVAVCCDVKAFMNVVGMLLVACTCSHSHLYGLQYVNVQWGGKGVHSSSTHPLKPPPPDPKH